jgi:hypothetical protein
MLFFEDEKGHLRINFIQEQASYGFEKCLIREDGAQPISRILFFLLW